MTFLQYLIVGLILYLCLYALINRLCQCIEHCATARAYGKLREAGVWAKMEDVKKKIEKDTEEKHNDAEQKA